MLGRSMLMLSSSKLLGSGTRSDCAVGCSGLQCRFAHRGRSIPISLSGTWICCCGVQKKSPIERGLCKHLAEVMVRAMFVVFLQLYVAGQQLAACHCSYHAGQVMDCLSPAQLPGEWLSRAPVFGASPRQFSGDTCCVCMRLCVYVCTVFKFRAPHLPGMFFIPESHCVPHHPHH